MAWRGEAMRANRSSPSKGTKRPASGSVACVSHVGRRLDVQLQARLQILLLGLQCLGVRRSRDSAVSADGRWVWSRGRH